MGGTKYRYGNISYRKRKRYIASPLAADIDIFCYKNKQCSEHIPSANLTYQSQHFMTSQGVNSVNLIYTDNSYLQDVSHYSFPFISWHSSIINNLKKKGMTCSSFLYPWRRLTLWWPVWCHWGAGCDKSWRCRWKRWSSDTFLDFWLDTQRIRLREGQS